MPTARTPAFTVRFTAKAYAGAQKIALELGSSMVDTLVRTTAGRR